VTEPSAVAPWPQRLDLGATMAKAVRALKSAAYCPIFGDRAVKEAQRQGKAGIQV
jgi:hypothetical protein